MAAEDDPAPSLLLEPGCCSAAPANGIWLRVVDAPAALAARGYDHSGETTLGIAEDADCPWNVGVYHLATDGRQAEVAKRPPATSRKSPSRPTALASLLAGYSSLSHLVRVGRAKVADDRRLPTLDALFGTRYRPHCMDGFERRTFMPHLDRTSNPKSCAGP